MPPAPLSLIRCVYVCVVLLWCAYQLVSAKSMKLLTGFKELFAVDKNNRALRRALSAALPPCIPHLGIFLSDLTFTEDGNPDTLLGMINFQKRYTTPLPLFLCTQWLYVRCVSPLICRCAFCRMKLAERIRWIKQYQQEAYNLTSVPVVQEYYKQNLKCVRLLSSPSSSLLTGACEFLCWFPGLWIVRFFGKCPKR
jgi:hypothetical protein